MCELPYSRKVAEGTQRPPPPPPKLARRTMRAKGRSRIRDGRKQKAGSWWQGAADPKLETKCGTGDEQAADKARCESTTGASVQDRTVERVRCGAYTKPRCVANRQGQGCKKSARRVVRTAGDGEMRQAAGAK
eukprot:6193124-Pleurochrysis_carterae.AAC.2